MTAAGASPAIRRLEFQDRAAQQVAARYRRQVASGSGPFYQAFAVVTLLGKTLVLGESVNRIAGLMPSPPLVLWLSRGRVLAENTFNTLQPGGRYHGLLGGGAAVTPLVRLTPELMPADGMAVCFGTVATFARGETPETSGFALAGSDVDAAPPETLETLRLRRDAAARRRPLILVYDEAHELPDRAGAGLIALEPDVILLASAALHLPSAIAAVAAGLLASGAHPDDLITIPRSARAGSG